MFWESLCVSMCTGNNSIILKVYHRIDQTCFANAMQELKGGQKYLLAKVGVLAMHSFLH